MAKKKKQESSGGGWMATYGDMVTLLLCFFVLLYAMSSMDEVKWAILVQSVNPDAKQVSQIVMSPETEEGYDVAGGVEGDEVDPDDEGVDDELDQLFEKLKEFIEENELQSDVEITKGENYTFITFLNNIFFLGNDYEIQPQGRLVLDFLGEAMDEASHIIKEVQILGHTSQGEPDVPNDTEVDRFLSTNRASEVATYIDLMGIVDSNKIIATGFGQHRPISPFDTAENRAKNRRVEIIITEENSITDQLNDYYYDVYGVEVNY